VTRHVIVHQFDPTRHVAGGIAGYIRDLIEHGGDDHTFAVVGVEKRGQGVLGRWRTVEIGGRSIEFMPVAHMEAGNQQRFIPHSLRLAYGLVRYRPRLNGAIVHNHRPELGAVTSIIFPRARRVQFIHDDALEAFSWRKETMWRFFPGVFKLFERRAVGTAERALVMRSSTLSRVRRHSSTAAMGANWYDARYFHLGRRERSAPPSRIGWAGRFEPPKDPLTAVAVFAELRARGVEFEAWMAGGGTLAEDVRAAVEQAGLGDVVRLPGVLSPAELADEFRQSDLFLMTSRWEGIPRAAIEARACGVPVVSTDAGELSSMITEGVNGYVSPSRSAADLADTIQRGLTLAAGEPIAATVADLEVGRIVPKLLNQLAAGRG
jgi:glycosyltransferase involved in cell wall biosynthesis